MRYPVEIFKYSAPDFCFDHTLIFLSPKKTKKKLYFSRLQLSESFPLSHAIIYVVNGILRRAKDIFAFLVQGFELCARGTACKLFYGEATSSGGKV